MTSLQFGSFAALSGNTLAFGVPQSSNVGLDDGAVYLFESSGTVWTESAPISPLDSIDFKYFGNDVDISGNLMVVGNQLDSSLELDLGSAYIFENNGLGWQQTQRLEPLPNDLLGRYYGSAVAVNSDTIAITADLTDEAYIFDRVGENWQQSAVLPLTGLFDGDLALGTNTLVIGAPEDITLGPVAGAAHIYERVGTQWQQAARLLADDGAPNDYFGWAVAVQGDLAVIGAPLDSHDGGEFAGAVYVFQRSSADSTWNQVAKLTADDAQSTDNFGVAVAIAGDTIVVGSMLDDDLGTDTGSVYVFKGSGNSWRQALKIQPQGTQSEAWFGYAVAFEGTTLMATSPNFGGGAAFIYDVRCE